MNLKALIKTWRAATDIVEWMGGAIFNGPVSSTGGIDAGARITGVLSQITYSAAPVLDASLGNDFFMNIADNVAFVIGAPTNPPAAGKSQVIRITFRNTSGGAHGAGTWNAVFKTQATVFPAIANGQSRTVFFRWNGTNWVELVRSAADIAN